MYCEVANTKITGSKRKPHVAKGKPSWRTVLTLLYSYWLPHNTLWDIYLRNEALPLLENSVNIIAWLLSTPGVRTHVGKGFKNCEISFAITSYAAGFVRSYEKLHRACKAIFGLCCDGICFCREHVYGEIFAFE